MPTPAERIYEAASGELDRQQARANQINTSIGPLGAGAAAAALLLKQALHDFSHAQLAQRVGIAIGGFGLAAVVLAGLAVLIGVSLKGVEPGKCSVIGKRRARARFTALRALLVALDNPRYDDFSANRVFYVPAAAFSIRCA